MTHRALLVLTIASLAAFPRFSQAQFADRSASGASAEFSTPAPDTWAPTVEKRFFAGLSGGINLIHYHTASFSAQNLQPTVITAQDGSGTSILIGASYQFPISDSYQNFFVFETYYDSKSASFNTDSPKNNVPVSFAGESQTGNLSSTLKARLSYLLLCLGYKYSFIAAPMPSGPSIQVAASLGIKMAGTFDKEVIISGTSSSGQAESQTETTSVAIDGAKTFRFGFRGELGYDIPLSEWFVISPIVGYDLPLTRVDNSDRDWTASSFYSALVVHLRFVLD
ncbi:MAG: hypothetical protein Q8916_13915 [Bacteroidota bacterium]|nr:hypothetical protein [Bacteroidota bacterium]MDP4231490.1 hypothetical protein [Bacteroidota bacterium]MDP4237147.1 hypothetical protein [Bacteroidota bacterium]